MNINVQYINDYARIVPVSVAFKTYKAGETYKDQMSRIRNFNIRTELGYVKQFYPKWYKEAMWTKRNQTVATTPNEFIQEMN